MVEIKKGETIIANDVKSGSSAKGDYWLCRVKNGKEYFTVWCAGLNASEGDVLKVIEITEVKKSRRLYQEKWYDNLDITAVLEIDEPTVGYKTPVGGADFAELDEDDSDLPFNHEL